MTAESIIVIIGGIAALAGIVYFVIRKLPKRRKSFHYTRKWRELQKLCADKSTWPDSIVAADKLLDEAMINRRITGKTMGERLVEAEKDLTNNDALWKAHKLANLIKQEKEEVRLKETDVKESLVAFRQGLRDMRAL